MYRIGNQIKESDVIDENGVYHEDWPHSNREDYQLDYGNVIYVNLIMDDKFERLKEVYNREKFNPRLTGLMAEFGRFDMLQWAYQENIMFPKYIMQMATGSGNLELVQWLFNLGYKLDSNAFQNAAASGNVKLISWMNEQPHTNDWSDFMCFSAFTWAAMSESREMMQWLIDHGAPMSPVAFEYAACYGLLDVLKFLKQVNCPWDNRVHQQALMKRKPEIIQWCKENMPLDEIKEIPS